MDLETIRGGMTTLIEESPLNRVEQDGLKIERIYDYPLVKVADASDQLFAKLQEPEVVGENHFLPSDWLNGAQSVISYYLPYSSQICKTNYKSGWASWEWIYGRIEGEIFNNAVREYLIKLMTDAGGSAVAPVLDNRFKIEDLRSNWSERHVAYIAGLGTFSLSKSLITEKGCAGRYGSMVTDLAITPSVKGYAEIEEHCNFCGDCIQRCPVGAIEKNGKNLSVCAHYIRNEVKPRFSPRYGCGKCQTAVPCENAIP